MNAVIVEEEIKVEWSQEERKSLPPRYGCELLIQNATMIQAKDSSLPSDAYLIWYKINDKVFMDICRCRKRSDLFDLYYDKFGPESIQKIDFGYGRVNPKLWGYKAPEGKKKR